MTVPRLAIASLVVVALLLAALGAALATAQLSAALLLYPALGAVYLMGAAGLHRHARWGSVIAGALGVLGTMLMSVILLFALSSVAYYGWRPDLPVVAGLPTYPSLALLVALLMGHIVVLAASRRATHSFSGGPQTGSEE